MHKIRELTRKQRYAKKISSSVILPVELCAVNFHVDQNLGFLIRAAACFGVQKINIIGSLPDRSKLNALSGSLRDYVRLEKFKKPEDYLNYVEKTQKPIISAEISKTSKSIFSVDFNSIGAFHLVVGNERSGVPTPILLRSTSVYVPMPGVGFCLNTSQAANVFLYEVSKQVQQYKAARCA